MMHCNHWRLGFLTLCLVLASLSTSTHTAFATAESEEPVGHLTVTGKVQVNGKPAATGDIVSSGSLVETAAKSSSVVSLGKLGRVEALPETRMHLRYETNISIVLETGSVKVSTGEGVSATVTRKD